MSTDQVLFGVGLILVLAVGSQVAASRLRIPALVILLPAGFTAGALTTDANPERLLGPAFQPLVSLAVAVILYDSGLALQWGKVRGRARRVVPRMVIWGVPATMAFAAVFAGLLLGMPAGAALDWRDLGGVRADGGGPLADGRVEFRGTGSGRSVAARRASTGASNPDSVFAYQPAWNASAAATSVDTSPGQGDYRHRLAANDDQRRLCATWMSRYAREGIISRGWDSCLDAGE